MTEPVGICTLTPQIFYNLGTRLQIILMLSLAESTCIICTTYQDHSLTIKTVILNMLQMCAHQTQDAVTFALNHTNTCFN